MFRISHTVDAAILWPRRPSSRDTLYYLIPPLRDGESARPRVNQIDLCRSADMSVRRRSRYRLSVHARSVIARSMSTVMVSAARFR
ncbi:hypothetical protein ALI144C_07130 [Actinosynnema sp. ALI-1.44]|nr:hypothetical protein ALI144C_07130 [Actinosynnema sp. ALI-1.44]